MKKRNRKQHTTYEINTSLIVFLLMLLLLSISVIAEILIPTYKTNPLLYAAFGTIAGLTIKSFMK